MLLINVHELEVVLANAIVFTALEDKVQHVRGVLSLERQDILVLGGTEHLGQGCQIHSQGDITVASVWRESLSLQHHGDKRDVRVVHGLQRDAGVIAVEVAILDEILDGIDHLRTRGPSVSMDKTRRKKMKQGV